jgi:NAD(P) transhydrogenase
MMGQENYDYDLLVIGSGPAGKSAAVQGAKLGRRVAVLERARPSPGSASTWGPTLSECYRVEAFDGINRIGIPAHKPKEIG